MKKTISFLVSSLLVGTGVLAQRLSPSVVSAGGSSARTASMTRPYFTQSGLFFLLLIALFAGHTRMVKASVPTIVPPTASKPTSADCVAPVYARGGITSVCMNETVVLYTAITMNSHTWIAPAGATLDSYTNPQVTARFTTTGPKTFTVTPQGYCTVTITITVKPTPAAPTLTGVSRRVDQSNTPLPLGQFANAENGNTLSFSATSGILADPPTTNISQVGTQSFSVTQTNTIGCVSGVTVFTLTVSEPPSPIRYVRMGATGSGNSWSDASGDLQSQINFTGAQQVWVATGTYKPGGNANTDISISFAMKNEVSILGGFPATGSPTLTERNPTSLTTVLSGDIGEVGDGTAGNVSDNSYHVIKNSGLTRTAVLDGFVIRDGYASYYGYAESQGGGMYNDNSSPTLTNCRFIANRAYVNGGGIHNAGGSPSLTNCSFVDNTGRFGGAMNNVNSSPTLINCRFMNNSSAVGAGMRNLGSSPTLTNCSFVDNDAGTTGGGGGMFNNDFSNPTLTNCSFVGNLAGYGGGILISGNSATLTNCSFVGNSAKVYGGAMYYSGSSVLTNCVLFSNGGANTFYNNNDSQVTLTYSLLEAGVTGYTDGGNNLTTTVSPFVSLTDARLNVCSPAINTGTNAANSTTTDPDGNPRIVNTTIDRGAYEYQGQPSFPTGITQQPPSGSLVCQGSTVSVPLSVSGTGTFTYQLITGTGTPVGPSQSTTPLTLANVQPAQSGSYSVIVTGSCNSVTSTAFSLTVNAAPSPTLINNGPIADNNQTVTLTAGGGTTYAFSPGATSGGGNTATVTMPGVYSVTVTTANGCTGVASTTVTGAQNPATVCRNGTVVIKVVATGNPVKYEWYKNTLNSARLADITNLQRGTATSSLTLINQQVTANYYVRVTDQNGNAVVYGPFKVTVNMGCVTALGRLAAEEVELHINLLGNPLIGEQLRAKVSGAAGKALNVQLLDLNGKSVRQQQWQQAESEQPVEWNLNRQASGVYLLQAMTEAEGITPAQRHTLKVIKP